MCAGMEWSTSMPILNQSSLSPAVGDGTFFIMRHPKCRIVILDLYDRAKRWTEISNPVLCFEGGFCILVTGQGAPMSIRAVTALSSG